MPELPHLILPRAQVDMDRRKKRGYGSLECPAVFVPEEERETGIEGALNGAEEEVHAGADCEPVTAS
jgi:hypothetical protein